VQAPISIENAGVCVFGHHRLVLGNVNTSCTFYPFATLCVCATYLLSDTQIRFGDKRLDFDWPKVIGFVGGSCSYI